MAVDRLGIAGRTIELFVQFLDPAGNPTDADDTPTVSITDSNGTVRQIATNVGVSLVQSPGLYSFSYNVPLSFIDGYAIDTWRAKIGNEVVTTAFEFLVQKAGSIIQSAEPIPYPGDDYTFTFSDAENEGVNRLLKILKKRVKNDGLRKVSDGAGGYIESPCPVFSNDELICFLVNSLSEFNSYPHFTSFTFADQMLQDTFMDIITQGAALLAMAAQSLIERGREFSITDNGITFQPPGISDILNTQYSSQLADYKEKLKIIKSSLKPGPKSLGTFRVTSVSPAYLRLRHLRSRQII